MNTQTGSITSVQTKKNKSRIVLPIVILLFVLAIVVFLAITFKVITVSGKSESYVLDSGRTQLGILLIEDNANAIFHEKSNWIGPVISKEGALIVQDDVTIHGPVVLFSNPLVLGENATVKGGVYLFAGDLTLKPGASVRHNVIMFAGGMTLEELANIRGDTISFAGGIDLHEKSSLRGDVVLFAGGMNIGREAVSYGKLIAFAGSLDLAKKSALHDDAVLFFGNAHLYPEAQVKGDVILTDGNATLDDLSSISGKLYLNPDARPGSGNLYSSSNAHVTRGVVKPENIEAIAGSRIAGLFLGYAILLFVLPVVVICLLMALMFYLGRQSRVIKDKVGEKTSYSQPSTQLTTPEMR
jgi:hypothetical protein